MHAADGTAGSVSLLLPLPNSPTSPIFATSQAYHPYSPTNQINPCSLSQFNNVFCVHRHPAGARPLQHKLLAHNTAHSLGKVVCLEHWHSLGLAYLLVLVVGCAEGGVDVGGVGAQGRIAGAARQAVRGWHSATAHTFSNHPHDADEGQMMCMHTWHVHKAWQRSRSVHAYCLGMHYSLQCSLSALLKTHKMVVHTTGVAHAPCS
jgi:hypothetical protein